MQNKPDTLGYCSTHKQVQLNCVFAWPWGKLKRQNGITTSLNGFVLVKDNYS